LPDYRERKDVMLSNTKRDEASIGSRMRASLSSAGRMLFRGLAILVCLVIAAGICVGIVGVGMVKGGDIVYGSVYIAAHWNDLPPDAQLCKKLFCRRADTVEKHLAGAKGYASESFGYFCPEHTRSEHLAFLDIGHRIGGLFWFACRLVAVVTAAVIWGIAVWAVGMVIVLPVLLLAPPERRKRACVALTYAAMVVGVTLGLTSSILYWWF